MRGKARAIFLTFLIIGTLTLTHNVKKVRAEGTIYIRPDGSIDPPAAPIQRDGNIYIFVGNIYETIVVQRNNVIIDGNNYSLQGSGSGAGFDISGRDNVTIENTLITGWSYGIHLYNISTDNTISNNNLTDNIVRGIFLSNSSSNTISGNKVVNNHGEGIFLWRTNTTTIIGNNVSSNSEDGISIGYLSFNNTIINNPVSNNSWAGIALGYEAPVPVNNTITGNNITNNGWAGIYVDHQNGNTFYHNNILGNALQVSSVGATNAWDNGYPSGGNYWNDYTGFDEKSGPNQDKAGSDGVGDTPYNVDPGNRDRYPFMNPWTPKAYDIAIVDVSPLKSIVGQGYTARINATVTNEGSYTQTFNVTVYANTIAIQTQTVTLESKASRIVTFTWNAIGFTIGVRTISAYATPIPGEVDTADNTRSDGTVFVTIPGDVDGNKTVDVLDLFGLGKAYGSEPGSLSWNACVDINDDDIVFFLDLTIINENYAKTSP